MPRASAVNFVPRFGSSAKSFRRCTAPTVLWFAFNAAQALRLVSGLLLGALRIAFAVAIIVFSFTLLRSIFGQTLVLMPVPGFNLDRRAVQALPQQPKIAP